MQNWGDEGSGLRWQDVQWPGGRDGFKWGRMEQRVPYGLVTDEGEAQARAREVGARHPSHQPRGDPVYHPS